MEAYSLLNIVIGPGGPEEDWTAQLTIDDEIVATLAGDATEGFRVVSYEEGYGPDDLEALADEIANDDNDFTVGEAYTQPETLREYFRSQVALRFVEVEVTELLKEAAVGIVKTDKGSSLMQIMVPEGGTLAGAIAHLSETCPGVFILNGLEAREAVLLYIRHAALPEDIQSEPGTRH